MGLREYRRLKNLSAVEFGRLVGVTHSTVLRWEDGKIFPAAESLQKIQSVTNGAVTPNDLFQVAA
jgi:transcriptional regulator with XRE-family HTH domain